MFLTESQALLVEVFDWSLEVQMAVASKRAILLCQNKDVKIMCPGEPASVGQLRVAR